MALEDKVMQKLAEYANYEPNQLLANEIGDHITGMGFRYRGAIRELSSDNVVEVVLDVELNGDDVDAVMSENVIYCYINADKLDFFCKPTDTESYGISNIGVLLSQNHFVAVNPKAWRDATKLYLLKINLNTGIIGRYDPSTGSFRNQAINWNSSTPAEVAQLLLDKDYLDHYLRSELSLLESYVSFATEDDLQSKAESESI